MSLVLSHLGSFAFRRPLLVLALWALLVGGVVWQVRAADPQVSANVTVDDTAAQEVLDEVRRELPEAGGTRGTVAVRAVDGGPVDEGERASALAAAMDAAAGTGYVVDLEARKADQEAEVEATVRKRALERTGEELTAQLTSVGEGLDDLEETLAAREADVEAQLAGVAEGQQPQLLDWQREQLASQPGQEVPGDAAALAQVLTGMQQELADRRTELTALRGEVDRLVEAPVEQQLDGLPGLTAQLEGLTADDPGAADLLQGVMDPEELEKLTSGDDPREQLETAVADQLDMLMAQVEALQQGPTPAGVPLVVDGSTVPGVSVSDDGTVAVLELQLTEQVDGLPPGVAEDVTGTVVDAVEDAGLEAFPSASLQPMEPPVGGHELVGLLVAAIVLVLTLGSLVAAGLPILTALTGVAVGVGGAFGLSEYYEMTSTTPVLALMLGLAVGIDYALFIVHKQRVLIVQEGLSAHDAAARAAGTAGSAVLFAGLTVVIALLGLLVIDVGFVTTMAVAAAATVALAVLISLTALPALLGLVGERIVRGRARHPGTHRPEGHGAGPAHWWARAVTSRPWLAVLAVVGILGLAALPAQDLRLGMPSGAASPAGTAERVNDDLTAQALGEGANGSLLVTVERADADEPDPDRMAATVEELAALPGVANASLRGTDEDRTLEIYQVTPQAGPTDAATEELVQRLREPGAISTADQLGVTGLTAINIDLSERLADAVPVYLGLVAGLSLLVLLLVLRSVVIPLAATAGFLLTVAATFGLTTAVFGTATMGWLADVDRPGVVLSFLPVMATGILYGLAMDYQVFLGSSMRESRAHGADGTEAVVDGFMHAGRVVVAAAVIMVSVFGVFILGDDPMVKQFGFALAAGILVDAFLVRMTFMPAVMQLAGRAAWWLPRWLDRVLPVLDIEGSRLGHAPGAPSPRARRGARVGPASPALGEERS